MDFGCHFSNSFWCRRSAKFFDEIFEDMK